MRFLAVLLVLVPQSKLDTTYYNNPLLKETRAKIAVIDTGITINETTKQFLCNGKHYDLTGKGVEDTIGHGTNIAGIIAKQIDVKKTCLLIIKYFDYNNNSNTIKAFRIAKTEKAKFVNYSSIGPGSSTPEKNAIQNLITNETYVMVASGNNSKDLSKTSCNYYPACYNFKSQYFKVVGNGKDEKPQMDSNYGEAVTDWRNGKDAEGFGIIMSGSSQATAILTSELASKE